MGSVLIYIGVATFVSIFLSNGAKQKNKLNIYALIGITIAVMFAALRVSVGTDFFNYCLYAQKYMSYSWGELFKNVETTEYLFVIISKITYTLGGRILFWGTFSTFIIVPFYLSICEYENIDTFVATFVFMVSYYYSSFNITRQYIALSFGFFALRYVYKNKLIPFIITVVIATGFHQSAFIILIFWFFWDHKNNVFIKNERMYLIVILAIVFVAFYPTINDIISKIFSSYNYSDYSYSDNTHGNSTLFIRLFEFVLLYFILRKSNKRDDLIDMMFCFFLITVIINITGFYSLTIKRAGTYFEFPCRIILTSYLYECFTKRSKRIADFIIALYISFIFFYATYVLKQGNLIPYDFSFTQFY